MEGRVVTNKTTGEKAWWDGKKLSPLGSDGAMQVSDGTVLADDKADLAYINTAREQAAGSLDSATKMERFLDLNRQSSTGPLAFLKPSNTVDPARQEMQAITAGLTPLQRPAGAGATSDYDAKMYGRGVPSVDKFGGTNEALAKTKTKQSTRDNARAAFLETWYEKRGTLTGAEPAFLQWYNKSKFASPAASATAGAPRKADTGWSATREK